MFSGDGEVPHGKVEQLADDDSGVCDTFINGIAVGEVVLGQDVNDLTN